jgi:hypothetical protein
VAEERRHRNEKFIQTTWINSSCCFLKPYFDMGATRSQPEVGDKWRETSWTQD